MASNESYRLVGGGGWQRGWRKGGETTNESLSLVGGGGRVMSLMRLVEKQKKLPTNKSFGLVGGGGSSWVGGGGSSWVGGGGSSWVGGGSPGRP